MTVRVPKKRNNNKIINDSISIYNNILNNPITRVYIQTLSKILQDCKLRKRKVFIAGNGGSSSIASHVSVDLTKVVGVKCFNFNEHNLITCFTNDYGQENWLKKALELYSNKEDLIILISSSGKSKNIINAAKFCKKRGNETIGLSGFDKNNALSKIVNHSFWVDSKAYNIIENIHQIILLISCDAVLGNIYYNSN